VGDGESGQPEHFGQPDDGVNDAPADGLAGEPGEVRIPIADHAHLTLGDDQPRLLPTIETFDHPCS
jgi:hypothetical protein